MIGSEGQWDNKETRVRELENNSDITVNKDDIASRERGRQNKTE